MNSKAFIDLHVHIGPEPVPRKFTVGTLVKAESGKLRAIALKNHFFPTTPLGKPFENGRIVLIGSVTLNSSVGGLNPEAVRAAASISARPIIVWFPTISAKNFLGKSEYQIPPEWTKGSTYAPRAAKGLKRISIIGRRNELTTSARKVLAAIAENNCILATGHLSWQESELLVREAKAIGINRIIVTHPIYQKIAMPVKLQIKLAEEGAYIEQAFSMHYVDGLPIEEIARQIKAVGAENCIMTSDMGQVGNPNPSDALAAFTKLLLGQGISEDEITMMAISNPAKLIQSRPTKTI